MGFLRLEALESMSTELLFGLSRCSYEFAGAVKRQLGGTTAYNEGLKPLRKLQTYQQ